MRLRHALLILAAVCVSSPAGLADDGDGMEIVGGTFVKLTQQQLGYGEFVGVVVRPVDRDAPVTVLLPRRQTEDGRWADNEVLVAGARRLRKGQKVDIAYLAVAMQKWVCRIRPARAEGDRERREGADAERRELRERRERAEGKHKERREGDRHEGRDRDRPELREGKHPEPREGADAERRERRERAEGQRRERSAAAAAEVRELKAVLERLLADIRKMQAEVRELRAGDKRPKPKSP